MSITVTVTDPALIRAVEAKASQQILTPAVPDQPEVLDENGNVVTPAVPGSPAVTKTADEYLQDFVVGSCHAFRDEFALDRITSVAFVMRFTASEYAALVASSDPILQGFVARLNSEPYVWLGSAEVQQGVGYVVSQGLLTQARADEVLAY